MFNFTNRFQYSRSNNQHYTPTHILNLVFQHYPHCMFESHVSFAKTMSMSSVAINKVLETLKITRNFSVINDTAVSKTISRNGITETWYGLLYTMCEVQLFLLDIGQKRITCKLTIRLSQW